MFDDRRQTIETPESPLGSDHRPSKLAQFVQTVPHPEEREFVAAKVINSVEIGWRRKDKVDRPVIDRDVPGITKRHMGARQRPGVSERESMNCSTKSETPCLKR